MLFSDIRGFTTMSETEPPEKIVEMLNIHFTVMADIILKHNGEIWFENNSDTGCTFYITLPVKNGNRQF